MTKTSPALIITVTTLLAAAVALPAAGASAASATSVDSIASAATTAPAAPQAPVNGTLLPVPVIAGSTVSVSASDVNALGVVAGNAVEYDGTTAVTRPIRWADLPAGGSGPTWVRQQLKLPAGASGTVAGLAANARAGGTITAADGTSRAARWTLAGTSFSYVAGAGSSGVAIGADGTVGVDVPDPSGTVASSAELVAPDGTRTPMTGGDLDTGYGHQIGSVLDRHNALVHVISGVGHGITSRPVVWQDGATHQLPVFSIILTVSACTSQEAAGGQVAYGGYGSDSSGIYALVGRHTGGAPGTDTELERGTGVGGVNPSLVCDQGRILSSDGGIAGELDTSTATGDTNQAVHWDAAGTATVVPLASGDVSEEGAAAASEGRMVILGTTATGAQRLFLWHHGSRTALRLPSGWTFHRVVELTDRGLLVANAVDGIGQYRPVVWNLSGR